MTAVITYSDDVTIILRSTKDTLIVQEALRCYEDTSRTTLNIQRSKAIARGSWDTSHTILVISYTELRVLSIKITTTIEESAIKIWRTEIGEKRNQARDTNSRTLCLDQIVLYIHNYLLAKAWYTAQIMPPQANEYGN